MQKLIILTTLLICAGGIAAADTPLFDPDIPNGEVSGYLMRSGETEEYFTEKFEIDRDENKDIYKVMYVSETEISEFKIEKKTMLPYYTHSYTRKESMDIETSTLLKLNQNRSYSDIMVLSFSDLKYVLRGFPFNSDNNEFEIGFINSSDDEDDGSPGFNIRIHYDGKEAVQAAGRTIECHKLELKMAATGILRVINSFIPKTYFWYSTDKPHYLVAYEGSGGFPGSEKVYIEMNSYSGW